jgi:CheY-like chemotaxis protein
MPSVQQVLASPLAGRRILVIEDEYFLADDIARAMQTAGAEVVGPAGDADEGLALLSEGGRIDAAILDINLHGEMIYPFASLLRSRHIPFAFATGYDKGAIPAEFQDVPHWEKPFDPASLARILGGLVR